MITSLDFRTGTSLFSLFGLLCLKIKVSNMPFVIEVKESEVFIKYVCIGGLYAVHYILFTNLGCSYFSHFIDNETEDRRLSIFARGCSQ